MTGPWQHLPQPFEPGETIPSNRSPGEWHFTFVCASGETYHHRYTDFRLREDAELEMKRFCAQHGNVQLAEYLDEAKHPGSGRNFLSDLPPLEQLMGKAWGAPAHRVPRPVRRK